MKLRHFVIGSSALRHCYNCISEYVLTYNFVTSSGAQY
jgi:hypothetical protein